MKTLFFLLTAGLWLLASGISSAADLTLNDGRVLRDATITGQSAERVTVKHADGLASIPKAKLPADLQAKYPVAVATALSKPAAGASNGPDDAAKAERIAKAKADEQARIARAKARQAAQAQWLKDNPQEHEVIYRVESTTPSTTITVATPEKGMKSFVPHFDQWGVYEEKFTAKDGAQLLLGLSKFGTNSHTGKYASTITISISVDGSVVRRESLEPRAGSLSLPWVLGATEQPEVVRSANGRVDNPSASAGTPFEGNPNVQIIDKNPNFKWGE